MTGPEDLEPGKVRALKELPQAIEPGRDLWPAIEARLKELETGPAASTASKRSAPRASRAQLRWLAAAAVVATLALGVWIGRSVLPAARLSAGRSPQETPAGLAPALPQGPSVLDAAYESDPRYEHQRATLLRSLQEQLARLPPPTRAKVVASLATIERAKKDLEDALGKDPGNALLQELLVNTYQDEMRVLIDVHEANQTGRGI